MKQMLLWSTVLAGVLVVGSAASARANECDKLTYFTFSAPVALPGVTLPAGTYRFSHPDCSETDHVLRVASSDGSTVYGTFLAIPDERTAPANEPLVVLGERPAGVPETVKAWFFRGDTTGDELIYPKTANRTMGPA